MAHKSGFVNIIGNPNVGKSTLMNNLVGEKISIITSKAQTTRHRIMGIVSGDDFQIVYSDTPGILRPNYKLQESMMNFVQSAFIDADVILYVVEVGELTEKNQETIQKIKDTGLPVILIINKMDTSDQERVGHVIEAWKKELPDAQIVPVSALHKFNLDSVFNLILKLLPESPAFYPKDSLTDKSERFIVSEIIREKILQQYKKEVPYSVEVVVESFKESEEIIRIEAILYVSRESQKGIIIGHKGIKIKHVGIDARKDIEHFFKKKVYLELFVKVAQDWRNKDKDLRKFGYQN